MMTGCLSENNIELIIRYKDCKVCSQIGSEYIIDVLSDGTVRKTKEPWYYE